MWGQRAKQIGLPSNAPKRKDRYQLTVSRQGIRDEEEELLDDDEDDEEEITEYSGSTPLGTVTDDEANQ